MSYKGFKHDSVLVIGSGSTINTYSKQIRAFIKAKSCATIGVNNMTRLCTPDYHLWTNRKQYSRFGNCVHEDSVLLLSGAFPKTLIKTEHRSKFLPVRYGQSNDIDLNENNILGNFRTAGVLAAAIATIMGSRPVWICGMDGFTLHNKKDLMKKRQNQHCYGRGYTDDASWDKCIVKDRKVSNNLDELSQLVEIKIITPTVFNKYHDPSTLGLTHE